MYWLPPSRVKQSGKATTTGGMRCSPISRSSRLLLAGVTEFLILDGVDQFPLLAIGMAPSVIAAALLFSIPDPKLAPSARRTCACALP